jgi:hypothetical protein
MRQYAMEFKDLVTFLCVEIWLVLPLNHELDFVEQMRLKSALNKLLEVYVVVYLVMHAGYKAFYRIVYI